MKHKLSHILIGLVSLILLVGLDQYSKYLAVARLAGREPLVLIRGIFELTYLENHGAAFGILQNQQWFFWILTGLFLLAALRVLIRMPAEPRFRPLAAVIVLLMAGAIGNLIDRVLHRYVVDFFYISLIRFPVFNVADIYVTVSVLVLLLLILFFYKEEELNRLWGKKHD